MTIHIDTRNSFDADDVCCVSLAEGYNIEEDHKFWALEANKSEVRDLNCGGCHKQVVMSNGMFERYNNSEVKPKVMCMPCALKLMEQNNV